MTKDDKCLRDTILAELRRRRGLLGSNEDHSRATEHSRSEGPSSETHAARRYGDRREQLINSR
jgi:hypothetical protein